ncbi:hypothetical protein GCM10011322_40890 [Salinarimonas ramus]|uniref:Type II toxin-antitoxin system RelE/ParE family toxin n=1 Tax=Salinarimonas ramus TaxID=690164 RepID=A0A917QGP9_9HYPH|nr:hypothetical protein GCM10011322_40890 [Salinarimonas ramus]
MKEYPLRFSLVPRYEQFGIRRRVVGDYLVLYRVLQSRIEVIHVVHGATDYATILFPEH